MASLMKAASRVCKTSFVGSASAVFRSQCSVFRNAIAPAAASRSARGKRYSARRRSFTSETLNPTEMNHEAHEAHVLCVFVLFVATLKYFVAGGGIRAIACFVSGLVSICLARVILKKAIG